MKALHTTPGAPEPLGATWDGRGTNFAIYSEGATGVLLCLFDADGSESRIPLRHRSEFVWHVYVEGTLPGTRYGYRVEGPWDPEHGLRFNAKNVLLDPYAKSLLDTEDWDKGAFSYDIQNEERDLVAATGDQLGAPLGLVTDSTFDWGADAPPNIPLRRTIIYEAHVKGLTMQHPEVSPELRGTYLGVASDPIIRHLRELGITAVELLPIQGFVDDEFLRSKKLRNYWGYNSIAFFAPDVRYRSGAEPGAEVNQFKRMVKALHAAGIEVILDVVYNHTAEGNHLGPTLSFRGIDNATYYRLVTDNPRYYFDYTGTGNSINVMHPQALRLIMDSLRYWVQEMHVDGFRFDLASTLARGLYEVDRLSSFFTIIHQDPVINKVKLIAEPWDLGDGGYQVGRFPVRWSEWNGQYRDTMRAFWRGDGGRAADLGYRLTGSSDLYQQGGRSPASSVNFITAHDGFTLRDLVSYDQKHNEANGESGQDGSDNNLSWNGGVEGETDDAGVLATRHRQARNILATLLFSQGVPMLAAGDELGRTQGGNNNAYCQDNEISWIDWKLDPERASLLDFTRRAIRLRRAHPLLERATFFGGREIRGVGARDIVWFRHDGASMTDQDWSNAGTSSLGVFMAGSGLDPTDEDGRPQVDDDLLLIFNASATDLDFLVPPFVERGRALAWSAFLDTAIDVPSEQVDPGATTTIPARSMKAFSRRALGPGGLQAAHGAPVSTYRLQLPGLGFKGARSLLSYLRSLGAGGVYTSPYLRAEQGSSHGYNVVDHASLSTDLGTPDDYNAFTDGMREREMRHIMDFVPNHVGIGTGENEWFQDVLENGASSVFADFFDIDWHPPAHGLNNKILLPVLGRQFGQEVNDGNIGIRRDGGRLVVTYYERHFPASPRSYALALERAIANAEFVESDPRRQELESVLGSLGHLPEASAVDSRGRATRAREKDVIQRRLARLCGENKEVAALLDSAVRAIAKNPEWLEQFLNAQNYRLSYWKVATEEINYRRFFDVNELAAIRMEDPRVFAATHSLVLDLIREGRVTGLRLDHTDGLYDPEGYLRTLQASAREALREGGVVGAAPIYVVAEKILETGEELPRGWALSGTTGYDFLAVANGLWIDARAEGRMTQIYAELTGDTASFPTVIHQAKRDVMEDSFSSEIHVLAQALKRIADKSRNARDFTFPSLARLIKETMAAFPVYRTYVKPTGGRQAHDEDHVLAAIDLAKQKNPRLEASLFDFIREVLLLREGGEDGARFAMKFQQISGPVMAKGVEDTAHYRFNRLVCLNEVGCDASRFGESTANLHAHNATILARWPLSMTTTTTHDTKRSEDLRSRLAVLTELPEEWNHFVRELDVAARSVNVSPRVSGADAYLFYQTIVGAFPFEPLTPTAVTPLADRLVAYMRKAIREAKLATSWATPNVTYEDSLEKFVRGAVQSTACLELVSAFVAKLATYGASNSLAQLAVRLASPGVPDVYQGCELWDLSLVDPDNRRPVDYEGRKTALADLQRRGQASRELGRELVETFVDGRIKMYVTWRGLQLRREHTALFLEGSYEPIEGGEHLVAFERRLEGQRLICVAPRLVRTLTEGKRPWAIGDSWKDTKLPLNQSGRFRDVFTGREHEGDNLALAEVLADFPVAWLLSSS
jgi:isoamylase